MKDLPRPDPRVDTDEYRAYWMQRLQRDAREPVAWAVIADGLVRAARVLQQAVPTTRGLVAGGGLPPGWDLPRAYLMLLAFAAENYLKGILIGRDPSLVGESRITSWAGGGHDLRALADEAALELTEDDRALLLTLSVFGEWMGRYPCPLRHDDRLPRPAAGGGFSPLGVVRGFDAERAFAICEGFARILDRERSQPKTVEPDAATDGVGR